MIIGSMAAGAKKRKRSEGLEYRPADSYESLVGARRCVACQMIAIPMGESM